MTPVRFDTVSPPRSVLLADSGCPPRANTIGSGFWPWDESSRMILRRLFWSLERDRRRAGCDHGGRVVELAVRREQHLPEPAELEVLSDSHRLAGPARACPRYRSRSVGDATGNPMSVGATLSSVSQSTIDGRGDLGLALELLGGAGDPDVVAVLDVVVVAIEDEDPVRGRRIAIPGGVLEVEAAKRRRGSFVVADDDTFRGLRLAGERGRLAACPGWPGSA